MIVESRCGGLDGLEFVSCFHETGWPMIVAWGEEECSLRLPASIPARLPSRLIRDRNHLLAERFATTQWSQVLDARDGSETEARAALDWLCNAYWYPLYAFVRRSHDAEEAKDLTQSFFAHLLEKDILKSTDRSKGRFRSFLLASLINHLSHQRERKQAIKRGGATIFVSLDGDDAEARFQAELAVGRSPEELFEHRWAMTVIERAMNRLRVELEDSNSGADFEVLQPYLTGSQPRASYREAGSVLELTESAVKNRVFRLRRRYGELLREEVAQTVCSEQEVDGELRHLLIQLRG